MFQRGDQSGRRHAHDDVGMSSRNRRARWWVAVSSVFAMVLMGASPALAEATDVSADQASVDAASAATPPVENVPAPAPEAASPPEPVVEPAPAPEPAPVAESAPVTESAPQVESQQPAEPTPAPATNARSQESSMRMSAQPVAPLPEPPFLRWITLDSSGNPALNATVTVQSRVNLAVADDGTDTPWESALTMTVLDNVGQDGYVGQDRDPIAGAFLISEFIDDADQSRTPAVVQSTGTEYRAQGSEASGDVAVWTALPVTLQADQAVVALKFAPKQDAAPVAEGPANQAKTDEEPGFGVFALGPDGAPAPYVFWTVENGGVLFGGTSFTIQGPHNSTTNDSDGSWGTPYPVVDNIGQPGYSGLDRDPDPGEFLVAGIGNNGQTAIQINRRYRVQPSAAPVNLTFTSTAWQSISRQTSPSNWQLPAATEYVDGVHDFGTWGVTALADCTGTCANIKITNNVVNTGGGTASASDWVLTAKRNDSVNSLYGFTSGVTRPVPTGSIYTLAATADTSVQSQYTSALSCSSSGSGASTSSSNGTATFNSSSTGTVTCTYTHTYKKPATIVVKKKVLRSDPNFKVTNAVFQLATDNNGTQGALIAAPWAQCTITSGAACTITVPASENGKRFWVVEVTAPAGTFSIDKITTGSQGTLSTSNPYPGRTGTIVAGQSQDMPQTASNTSLQSVGFVTNALENPKLVKDTCDAVLNVMLILDTSSSISTTQRSSYATGLGSLLDVLQEGAGSKISVVKFDTSGTSPGLGIPNLSTVTPALKSTLLANLTAANYGAGTNWDDGLRKAATAMSGAQYDVVFMITDGAPNYFSGGGNTNTRFQSVEEAVLSANAIKNSGVPVWTIGVGDAVAAGSLGETNLRSISQDGDVYLGAWESLGDTLKEAVMRTNCQVPIEVSKTTVNAGATLNNVGGWTFGASLANTVVSTPPPAVMPSLVGAASQTTTSGANGVAKWTAKFTHPTQTSDVVISETIQSGWAPTSVVCTSKTFSQQEIAVVGSQASVTLPLTPNSPKQVCVFTNTKIQVVPLHVDKVWNVTNSAGVVQNTYTIPGAGASVPPSWMSAQLVVNSADQPWGSTTAEYAVGSVANLSEGATLTNAAPPGCELVTQEVTAVNGISLLDEPITISATTPYPHTVISPTGTPDANEITVTNTVMCTQSLTLIKNVNNDAAGTIGTSAATDWKLKAVGPSTVEGPTGTSSEVAAGSYTLSEEGLTTVAGPAGYTPGLWTCTRAAGNVTVVVSVTNNVVPVNLGESITCQITNTAQAGSVTWNKVASDAAATPLAGSSWTLTGPGVPANTVVEDCTSGTCPTGAFKDTNAAPGAFALNGLKWGTYTLVERTPPPGFALDTTSHTFTVTGSDLEYVFAEAIVNNQLPGPQMPLTGGIGRDQVYLGGLFVLLFALAGYGAVNLNRRRGTRSVS